MLTLRRRGAIALIAAVFLLTFSAARHARADVLAEFFFWDEMGNAAGQAARSLAEYRAERQLWRDKIAAAKRASDACGGCPAAEAELRKWQKVENQFQDVAGSLAASVGMPPVLADFLGIDLPLVAGGSRYDRARACTITPAAWAAELPDFCQQAVAVHLSCLRRYEQENGYCSFRSASVEGGACWNSFKLFRKCGAKDYEGFAQEAAAQAYRAKNKNVPEYLDYGPEKYILYSNVTDDFTPKLPPRDVVEKAFEEGELRRIVMRVPGRASGTLQNVELKHFNASDVAPNSGCFSNEEPTREIMARICDDLIEMNWRYSPKVIACYYSSRSGYQFADAYFWYGKAPEAADTKRLMERASAHPLLRIKGAHTDCPASLDALRAIEWEVQSARASLAVTQIPESTALPRSTWRAEQRQKNIEKQRAEKAARLDGFPIAGHYQFSAGRFTGRRLQSLGGGRCEIAALGETDYSLTCKNRRQQFSGVATREEDGLLVIWSDESRVLYNVGGDATLNGFKAGEQKHDGYIETLNRTGDYSQEEFAGMMAGFPFAGKYRLELSHEKGQTSYLCEVKINKKYTPARFPTLCRGSDGSTLEGEGIPDYRAVRLTFNSWYPKRLSAGEQFVQNLYFPIDPTERRTQIAALNGAADYGVIARFARTDDNAMPQAGTPLDVLDEINRKQARRAEHRGIKTLEELARLTYDEAMNIGMGWTWRRDLAREYLKAQGKEEDWAE